MPFDCSWMSAYWNIEEHYLALFPFSDQLEQDVKSMAPLILLGPALPLHEVCFLPGWLEEQVCAVIHLHKGMSSAICPHLLYGSLGLSLRVLTHGFSPLFVCPPPQLFLQHTAFQHAAISHIWSKLLGFTACYHRKTYWPNQRSFQVMCNWTLVKKHKICSNMWESPFRFRLTSPLTSIETAIAGCSREGGKPARDH